MLILPNLNYPFGKGKTAEKILGQIKKSIPSISLKKSFYDFNKATI
ncbi:MAG: hypothetical protein RL708_1747 [Bacteroidota bacterium]|jgi:hypothetical protein